MKFKQRKELADKYREWVKQAIHNHQTMILDCVESVIAFLDINGYLNEVVRCKDCKYEDTCCRMIRNEKKPTDYCSFGERREDDKIH